MVANCKGCAGEYFAHELREGMCIECWKMLSEMYKTAFTETLRRVENIARQPGRIWVTGPTWKGEGGE